MAMKTAAAYIRVSDSRQDEYSPESQLKLIRAYAAKNGFAAPDEYVFYDDGISGSSAAKRTRFNEMIALAKQKDPPFTAILVWKFSRFARNQEESIVFKNLLRKNGVSVISVSEPISDDPFGGLIERIIEWMDEYYLIRLGPEVRRGMAEKASRGEAMGCAALGYRYVSGPDGKGRYEPDPALAPTVRGIFEDYAAGVGMRAIADGLNRAGVRSRRGNPIDNRGVEYILHNPVYIGRIRWSREGKLASQRIYDDERYILVDGGHEPLIDPALWDRVQARLKESKSRYVPYRREVESADFMLKGLLRCSACGGTLTRIAKKTPGLQCHNYARGSCGESHYISMPRAEALVLEALRKAVSDEAFPIQPPPRRPRRDEPEAEDFDRSLAAVERKLRRLSEAYLAGVYDLDQFKSLKAYVDEERDEVLDRRRAAEEAAKAALAELPAFRVKLAAVLPLLEDAAVPAPAKAEALRSVVSQIVFRRSDCSVDVHFNL